MDEKIKTGIAAINKWFYFATNFTYASIHISDYLGERDELLPTFFYAFSPDLRGHLKHTWESCQNHYGCYGSLMAFYAQIDAKCRKSLLYWAMENYDGEMSLNLDE